MGVAEEAPTNTQSGGGGHKYPEWGGGTHKYPERRGEGEASSGSYPPRGDGVSGL